eukprot:5187598-Pleurochrysis_carterae.AAC.1
MSLPCRPPASSAVRRHPRCRSCGGACWSALPTLSAVLTSGSTTFTSAGKVCTLRSLMDALATPSPSARRRSPR